MVSQIQITPQVEESTITMAVQSEAAVGNYLHLMLADDDIPLPNVQPKSFAPTPSGQQQQGVHFADDEEGGAAPPSTPTATTSTKPSLLTPRSKSKSLGLSLRRITPDKSPRNNNNVDDGHSTATGSFVSRLTGKSSRSRNSIQSSATPVTSHRSQRMKIINNNNIEKQQKMEDEYYVPTMQWADDEEEQLDDGELPSLKRVNSSGSRRSDEHRGGYAISTAAATAAARAALVSPDMQRGEVQPARSNSPPAEQLKVAGFWSQLDDNDDDDSSKDSDAGYDDDDGPDDERQWRKRSRSPPRNRRSSNNRRSDGGGGTPRRVGFATDAQNDGDSIGLDLIPSNKYSDDDDDDHEPAASAKKKQQQQGQTKSRWNLLEQAACYANENAAMEEDVDDDEQSLDRTFATGKSGRSGKTSGMSTTRGGGETVETTRGGGDDDEEENDFLACITTTLTTLCGIEAFPQGAASAAKETETTSPNRKRAHEIIDKDHRRRGVVTDDEASSQESEAGFESILDEEPEDVAVELEYHSDQDIDGDKGGSKALSPKRKKKKKKKKGITKFIPKTVKKYFLPEEQLTKTVVTTTTRSGAGPEVEGVEKSKSRITDMHTSLTFEQEILGEEDENAGSPAVPTLDATPEEQAHADDDDEVTFNNEKSSAAAAAAGGAIAAMAAKKSDSSYSPREDIYDEEELQSEAAAWSTNKKNLYLRQLAERAKMEYAAKAGSSAAGDCNASRATGEGDDDVMSGEGSGGGGASNLAIGVGAAAVVGTAAGLASNDEQDEEMIHQSSSYTADYNSFSAAEKRQFLRLLNSGMSPQEAARSIAEKRDGGDEGEGEEGEGGDEKQRSPLDEDMPSLMSDDPPGATLGGGSGESAELSTKEEDAVMEEGDVSRSEMAQDSSKASTSATQGKKTAALAAIPLVPAIVRARSKSRERKTTGRSKSREREDDQEEVDADREVPS